MPYRRLLQAPSPRPGSGPMDAGVPGPLPPAAAILALVVLLVGASACRDKRDDGPRTGERPPVVLISIDTLRSDRLPAYGYQGVETPAIDDFRKDAILFERAYSHVPLTLPSHVSLFSGQLPTTTGVRNNSGYRLEDGYRPYLPILLREAGYATGGAVSAFVLREETGVAQGFEVWDDATGSSEQDRFEIPERQGAETLEAIRPWMRRVAGSPFFLFFHLYEPHYHYKPPEPHRTRWGSTYEGEIAAADAVVGELLGELRRLGIYEQALVVLLSDHGEGLMDHGERGHGVFVYREAVQVPLLVKLPGNRRAGEKVAAPAQLVDVLPTVTDLLGLPRPEGIAGSSLLELADAGDRVVYAESMYPRLQYGWSSLTSVIGPRFHYIQAPRPELYDLLEDPAEEKNVIRDQRRALADLRRELETRATPLTPPGEEDPETLQQLAALGYVSAGPDPGDDDDLPDPKDRLREYVVRTDEAMAAYKAGDNLRAVELFREGLEANPAAVGSWQFLGEALRKLGRREEALEAFGRALALGSGPEPAISAGGVLVELGRLEEARGHARLAADLFPEAAAELEGEVLVAEGELGRARGILTGLEAKGHPAPALRRRLGLALSRAGRHQEALGVLRELVAGHDEPAARNALALALVEAGRPAEAESVARAVVEDASNDAGAHEALGLALATQGRPAEARPILERAVELDPRLANAWNVLGVARLQTGDLPGALAAWERAVDLDSTLLDARYNLAFTAARTGRRALAREHLERYVELAPPDRFPREVAQARELLERL